MYELLEKVRSDKPLVHHITNWVTIYDCANMTRTVGALPVMAHAIEESAEMASIASSLVLNIGTLTPGLIDSMINAGKRHVKLLNDNWTVVTKDRSLSAQWEHTLLITDDGVEILTLREDETF